MSGRKLSVEETMERAGFDENSIEDFITESSIPACCSDGCEVEPDGECPHGHPSLLIELGII